MGGKYDGILIFANFMNVEDEDFLEAARQLDAMGKLKLDGSLTPKQIMGRIDIQIKFNKLKKKIDIIKLKGVGMMPLIGLGLIVYLIYSQHHGGGL